jgi:homoserine dehydrogenase
VVADLIDIARGSLVPAWGASSGALSRLTSVPMAEGRGGYYLRLTVRDRPGVIAEITAVLRDCGVSLKSMLQHGQARSATPDEAVPIVLVTHETGEAAMRDAIGRIAALDVVLDAPAMIRIEPG